jgi:hypothetical protein
MNAPLYPPATAFVQPVRAASAFNTRLTPIGELMKVPAAWAIVSKELPAIQMLVGSDVFKPHVGNFSLRSMVQFGIAKPEQLDKIDRELAALGGGK